MNDASQKVKVFLTVDTEPSIGGAFNNPKFKPIGNARRIFCSINGKDYGIPLFMDILDDYNLKATFFVEVLSKLYFGEDEAKQACEVILKRRHDVQLHIHPNYQNFQKSNWVNIPQHEKYSDFMADYSLDEQKRIIKEAKELLVKYGVENPVAFRAGCFGANNDTLLALKANGFSYDSSYNVKNIGQTCFMNTKERLNDACEMNSIIEFPITNFSISRFTGAKLIKPMDLSGVSFYEMKKVLKNARKHGLKHIVIILHSFSFVKTNDVQYTKMRPDWIVISRFRKLCRFLSNHTDKFEVITFNQYDKKSHNINNNMKPSQTSAFPVVGILPAMIRKTVQGINRIL